MAFYFISFRKIAKRTVTCKYCGRKIRKGEPYWLTAETYWGRRVKRITCYDCARSFLSHEIPRRAIREQRLPGRREVYLNETQLRLAEELNVDLGKILREMGFKPILPDGWKTKNQEKIAVRVRA